MRETVLEATTLVAVSLAAALLRLFILAMTLSRHLLRRPTAETSYPNFASFGNGPGGRFSPALIQPQRRADRA
ncbi:hypothetical protein [Roseicella sp. DB1501]|uniref:hypothetical protein n=1 Tax=Roseicella sp. DB1501 TaxID=2730925 RepID=UPI0014921DC2|nr:hypothetical protein [Roseicella sp. DB1501]NOG72936.1 hypothetical protein [Roseicella sp. DB1501]